MIIDISCLFDRPEALSKICEAVAKEYYDNVLHRPKEDMKPIGDLYSILFNLNPNWRMTLKTTQQTNFADKYKHITDEITSLPLYDKRKNKGADY